jgi:hypothetical protein
MITFAVLFTFPTVKDVEQGLLSAAEYLLKYQDGELNAAGLLATVFAFFFALPLVVMAEAVATLSE